MLHKIPIISEKLSPPLPPSTYMPRKRLDRKWDQWADKRLVLVTAGAGFGKTSFLAANARSSGRVCNWLCLDERDADIPTFCAHLQAMVPKQKTGTPIEYDPSDSDFSRRVLADFIRVLQQEARERILIIDDVHLLKDAHPVLSFLESLVRYLPSGNTLVLSSREPIEIATMKLKSTGSVAEMTTRDLEFRKEEMVQLFRHRFPGIKPDSRLSKQIILQTEGWAAGLEIFFQVLDDTSPDMIQQTLERLDSAGAGWFEYFAEEVVSRLPDRMRDFLYRSSILPRLEVDLCNVVLDIKNSRSILIQLVKRNLFTLELDEGNAFRYHNLFRTFLREQLSLKMDEHDLLRLKTRMAKTLASAGAWADAAAAYAESGNPKETVKLMERIGEKLFATGQYEAIHQALAGIPPGILQKSAATLYIKGRLLDIQGKWDEAEVIYRQVYRSTGNQRLKGTAISLIGQMLMRRGEYLKGLSVFKKALHSGLPMTNQARGRILMGFGTTNCELGRIEEGKQHYKRAVTAMRRARNLDLERQIDYLYAANVHVPCGEFDKGKEACRRALAHFRKTRASRRICTSLMVLAHVYTKAGETEEARPILSEAIRIAETYHYKAQLSYSLYLLGRCEMISGDSNKARELFQQALAASDQCRHVELAYGPQSGLAELHLRTGNRHAAREMIKEVYHGCRIMGDPLQEAQCCIILGQIEERGHPQKAVEWWRKAEKITRRIKAMFEFHHTLLLRLDIGDVDEKKIPQTLRELLSGTAKCGHDTLYFVFEPDRASRLLSTALERKIETDYVKSLFARLGRSAIPHLVQLTMDAPDEIKVEAVDVLSQIGGKEAHSALSRIAKKGAANQPSSIRAAEEINRAPATPLKIHALGPLNVSIGNKVLSLADWKSARALRFFQLLLIHRFRWIPKDQVMETLWPGANVKKVRNNLWQTVHHLRKILEPDLVEARDSCYLRFQNEAYRIEPGEGFVYDVLDFENALRDADSMWSKGKPQAAEKKFQAALELYRGDFLQESPYEDFAAAEREHIRELLLRGLEKLLKQLAKRKKWNEIIPLCRKGLSLEPYLEEHYFYLIHAFLRMGNRHEALNVYHQYEEMMIREMGLLPSPQMKTLVDKVVAFRSKERTSQILFKNS